MGQHTLFLHVFLTTGLYPCAIHGQKQKKWARGTQPSKNCTGSLVSYLLLKNVIMDYDIYHKFEYLYHEFDELEDLLSARAPWGPNSI